MSFGKKVLGNLQRLGKALMTPIAVMPAAALLLRLGQADVWQWTGNAYLMQNGIPPMAAAGSAIIDNLAILFAIGIAVGLAEDNNGVAGISATVGYLVLTLVAKSFNADINMGVLGGIVVGVIAAILYNKYKDIQVPQVLGFFGGKRFVPIVTSLVCLGLGIIAGFGWIRIQWGLDSFGNTLAHAGALGAFAFGFFNRLLIPFGLHHVLNSLFWFQFGTYNGATGDIARFFAGDPTAGTYMTGFFPIMMFALPAACLAMITTAKKENRKKVTGLLLSMAVTSFLTGVTEPIEFSFMFLAPVLYVIHALLTGASLAITNFLGMRDGFGFSAGLTDYLLNFNIATNPLGIALVGLIFAALYYVIFVFCIKKFNLKTPGREEEYFDDESELEKSVPITASSPLDEKAAVILEALGGKENIDNLDACVTRIRVTVKDASKVNESAFKKVGANGMIKVGENNLQIVMGAQADPIVTRMKRMI
ncbi:N-acetylglucosamine-specific PTS transporter subunit IIBC [Clostridium fallax]|uniref:PTS system N-acetylglucosamine-specific IIB component, Glc family /PTS system N-acetylglucosamine-specific IIC component, Glc family n=1 Tax=Clostridium fallax TaxID=1533 RepID=A0A1M4ZIU0_9CLOT|nr:N-acetylglucosamine-specific PTS transporter subunit IIBC [Clostridium fallax]SHF17717.1 PTS system N-acetylglucosamine-specific IIB component, Glc family /PTS system N-acetylglucosamine-specific IIC component, Glc family [Clostridium fallax]SQB22227.1 PTS system transporter subunit IIC [Clostridium fallax]